MQLLSVLLLTSLSSIGSAAPASIFDKFCSPTNDSPDCLDENQNWGFVVDPEPDVEEDENDGARPISFEPIVPIRKPTKPAEPSTDLKEVCFNKSDEVYQNCLNVEKKANKDCILASDKVEEDCLKA